MAESGFARVMRSVQRGFGGKPPRIVAVQLGQEAVDHGPTTSDNSAAEDQAADRLARTLLDPWEQTRLERYRDYREINEEVPELSRAVQVATDFVFGGDIDGTDGTSFEVLFALDAREEVQAIVDQTIEDLGMHEWIRGVIHEGKLLGDAFTELSFTTSPVALVGERHRQPEVVRVMARSGKVEYYEVGGLPVGSVYQPATTKAVSKQPFQIIHYAPNAARGTRYGRSLLASARKLRRKHETNDDITSMLAIQRADGDVFFLWPFPEDMDDQKIKAWVGDTRRKASTNTGWDRDGNLRRRLAARLEGVPRILPFRLVRDQNAAPQVVQTRPANLQQMVEVLKHQEQRMFVATGVPQGLVGSSADVNAKSTLEIQGLHFMLTVRNDQHDAARMIADVLVRALAVRGIAPEPGEFEIVLPDSGAFDESLRADIFARRATGVQSLVNAGLPLRAAMEQGFALDGPTLDAIDELQQQGADVTAVVEAVREELREEAKRVRLDPSSRVGADGNVPPGGLG